MGTEANNMDFDYFYGIGNTGIQIQKDGTPPKFYDVGVQKGRFARGDIHISTINGDDANEGSLVAPIKSFTRLKEIAFVGANVLMECDSVWESDVEESGGEVIASVTQSKVEDGTSCITTDATLQTCKISSYGYGAKPKITGAITVPFSAITFDSGNLYTFVVNGDNEFQFDLAALPIVPGTNQCYPYIIIDGECLVRATSKANAEATQGSFYVSAVGATWTYFVHGFDSEDLTTTDIQTPLKTTIINTSALRTNFAELKDVQLHGASGKDGSYLSCGVIDGVAIGGFSEHNSLYAGCDTTHSVVKNLEISCDQITVEEAIEVFANLYTVGTKFKNINAGKEDVEFAYGLFSHGAGTGGIKDIIIDGFSIKGTSRALIATIDCVNTFVRRIDAGFIGSVILERSYSLLGFNDGPVPDIITTEVYDSVIPYVGEPLTDDILLSNSKATHKMLIENSFCDAHICRIKDTSNPAINIDGTYFKFKNSNIVLQGRSRALDTPAPIDPVPQDVTFDFENSLLGRRTIDARGQGIDVWQHFSQSVLYISEFLAGGNVAGILKAQNSMFEKCLMSTNYQVIMTLADLKTAYGAENIGDDVRYGVREVNYTDANTSRVLGQLLGAEAYWLEDPNNSSNYLLTLKAPDNDMLIFHSTDFGLPFIPRLTFKIASSSAVVGIQVDDAGTFSTYQTVITGASIDAADRDEYLDMVDNGYLRFSIPKTDISDTDSITWEYITWDYDGNYERTEIVNGEIVGGTAYDMGIGNDKNKVTQKEIFNF